MLVYNQPMTYTEKCELELLGFALGADECLDFYKDGKDYCAYKDDNGYNIEVADEDGELEQLHLYKTFEGMYNKIKKLMNK